MKERGCQRGLPGTSGGEGASRGLRRAGASLALLVSSAALAGCSVFDLHVHLTPEVSQVPPTSERGTVVLSLLEDGFDHSEDHNLVSPEDGLRVGILRGGFNNYTGSIWTADNARGVITDALAQSLGNQGFKVEPSVTNMDGVLQVRGTLLELMVENTASYSHDAVCAIELTVSDGQRAARRKFRGHIDDSVGAFQPVLAGSNQELLNRAIAKAVEEAARGVAEFAGNTGS